jgi:hypothetical protein
MMRTLREWLLRLWATFRRRRTDADLEQELRLHLALAADEAHRRGQPPEDAERAARLHAGGVSQALDALRDQRGLPWIDAAMAGVGILPGLVFRHRGYFTFATTTLAVAVGVNLVVFTVVNALWLRPLPFPAPDRVVTITSHVYITLDAPALRRVRPQPFEAVAGQVITADDYGLGSLLPRLVLNGRDVETVGVTPEYFKLLGLAIRGRDFTQDDNRAGAEPVAIISDRLWSREFGRRPDVVGAVASAQPFSIRIVGIAPRDFEGARRGEQTDVWIPSNLVPRIAPAARESAGSLPLMIFARLAPGQSVADVARHLLDVPVDDGDRRGFTIVPLKDVFGTPKSPTFVIREGSALSVVAGLAMLVLVGGCATLAALVLVHYERRRRELAVRVALGASRMRLTGELSRELLLIAVSGTLGAVLVAAWGLRAIPSLSLPGGVNLGRLDLSIDWRVLGAAVAATLLTLVAAACLPVSRFTRASLAGDLLAGPAATSSAASQRIRQMLLALHVSATIIVLIAAGLFVRAVIHGFGNAAGFDFERTAFVTVQVNSPSDFSSIKSASDWAAFDYDRLWKAVAARKSRVRRAVSTTLRQPGSAFTVATLRC